MLCAIAIIKACRLSNCINALKPPTSYLTGNYLSSRLMLCKMPATKVTCQTTLRPSSREKA